MARLLDEGSDLRCKYVPFAVCVKELPGCQRLSGQGWESTKDTTTASGVMFGVAKRVEIIDQVGKYGWIVFAEVDDTCSGFLLSLDRTVWE